MMIKDNISASFFDMVHDRSKTGSLKYDTPILKKGDNNAIPMPIADMDFKIAPPIEKALLDTAKHGIFGYTDSDDEYDAALIAWYAKRMGWTLNTSWNIKAPGVVYAIFSPQSSRQGLDSGRTI